MVLREEGFLDMATRFGAVSPAQAYATKVRWVVATLVGIILILIITLIAVAKNSQTSEDPNANYAVASEPVQAAIPTVEVLIAMQRIEEGATLAEGMFGTQEFLPDRIPQGAVLAKDKPTVLSKFAASMIPANLPILREHVAEQRPVGTLHIPAGFRAVTITVDARQGVEGFARPNSRVDVLWTYTDRDKRKKVATIVRFVKILSVGGATNTEGAKAQVARDQKVTVTLLVAEKDAKKIELARTLGVLSLTLVGGSESPKVNETPDPVDINSILGVRPEVEVNAPEPVDGVMYTLDKKTGKQVKYELVKGRWKRAADN